jgi:hypothetical protein
MHHYLRAGTVTILLLSILGYVLIVISIAGFPYTVDYGEAPIMDQARRILAREPLYKADLSISPFVITNYPPVYPFLIAIISQITKVPLLLSGRIISILATALSAGLIASLVKSITSRNFPSLIALGLFLGHPYVLTWSALARVDMVALSFCLTAILILYHRWYSRWWLAATIICFLASIYTRQSYLLAGPLTGFFWLWSRDRQKAGYFIAILCLSVVGLFVGINTITHGGFYLNTILANINQYDISILARLGQQLLIIWPVIILGCLVSASLSLANHHHRITPAQNPFIVSGVLVFFSGSFLSASTAGKVGSGVNYFLELIAACSLLGATTYDIILMKKFRLKTFIQFAFIGQLVWLLVGAFFLYQNSISSRWEHLGWYDQIAATVREYSIAGPILSDDYLGMVVQTGLPVIYQPFEYGQLYQAGLWNPNRLAQEIRSGHFSLILIGGDTLDKPCCWPPELITAIQASYQVDHQPGLLTFTPRP